MLKTNGIKALVVDDNEVNILVVASMLEQFNIETQEATSGKDAIEKVKKNEFDIIFMDYLMPEMNGIEATQHIRSMGKAKRPIIIALSANETQDMKLQFEAAGVDDVTSKPLVLDSIYHVLEKWIPKERLIRIHTEEEVSDKEQVLEDAVQVIKQVLEEVEELDVDLGLKHIANQVENYIMVLDASVTNIQSEIEKLRLLNASQTHVSSMKINFHSLKGVLANIGAVKLSEQSHLFELAAGNQEIAFVKKGIITYIESVKKFADSLEQALLRYGVEHQDRDKDAYIPMSEEEYAMYKEELAYYLERYEFNYLSELIEKLIQASQGQKREIMKEIEKRIKEFCYEEALQLLNENFAEEADIK